MQKQRTTSSSSTESEVVSLSQVIKAEDLPLMDLWDSLAEVFVPSSGGRKKSLVSKKRSSETRQLSPSADAESSDDESVSLQSQIASSDSECE